MFASRTKSTQNDVGAKSGGHLHVPSYLEILAFYGLLAVILAASIPYGSVAIWHKSLLVALIGVFAGFRVIDGVLRGSFRIAEPVILLPLVGVLCLAVIQTQRWPGGESAISADPHETKAFILIFGAVIVATEVLFHYATTMYRIKCLIGLVIVVGVSSAVFGVARDLFFDTQTNFLAPSLQPEQSYAQFINRNHFVFLMEMVFGLLLGILIKGALSDRLKFGALVFAGILIYAAINANSRGGLIALAGLILLAVPLHLVTRNKQGDRDQGVHDRTSKNRSLVLRICGAAALSGLVFTMIVATIAIVGGEKVVSRIETIKDEVQPVDSNVVNRKHIWSSTIELIKDQPILGVGFGGYGAAITRFDTSGGSFSLQQAHNDYLEILSNGGIVAFALFSAFGAIVVSRISRNLKSSDPLTKSSCFGAALGISGVLIHSFVDFGLHIMINALILAVLVVIGTTDRSERAA